MLSKSRVTSCCKAGCIRGAPERMMSLRCCSLTLPCLGYYAAPYTLKLQALPAVHAILHANRSPLPCKSGHCHKIEM